MNARDVIAANPFFADVLDDAEIDRLARWAHSVEKAPGEDLIVEDDAGASLFIIVAGEVEVLAGEAGRRSKHIARLGPGAVVGEMSLMTGERRSATVRALTALRALEVTDMALGPILDASPHLVDRFADVLRKRQRELDRAYGTSRFSLLDQAGFASLIRGFFGRNI